MSGDRYNKQYYKQITSGSSRSAFEVVPIVAEFIQPKSVLDVGCGTGTWLAAWKKAGIDDYLGMDGSYVQPGQLFIERENFFAVDLGAPFHLQRKFDLAMSLEVAEHIHPEYAESFVASLCLHSDVILFSAAIPGQGGVNHFNEQYPQYWSELFNRFGFSGYDCIRSKIWLNRQIDTCYRQNLLFFVSDKVKQNYQAITKHDGPLLPLVHPEHYQKKDEILLSYQRIVRTPFHAGWHFVKKLFYFPYANRD